MPALERLRLSRAEDEQIRGEGISVVRARGWGPGAVRKMSVSGRARGV